MSVVTDVLAARDSTDFRQSLLRHVHYSLGTNPEYIAPREQFLAVALAVRDRMVEKMLQTLGRYRQADAKRLYYLSMEFLIGRSLRNNLFNLGLYDTCRR